MPEPRDTAPRGRRKNALYVLADSLRYDVFADPRAAEVFVPNLVALIRRGFLRHVVSNANSTQFALPALFSLTYPLDYGGYNNGIVDRPKSYVEILQEHGYETHLVTTTYHLFPGHGYERGFGDTRSPLSYSGMLNHRIKHQVLYHLEREAKGEITREELRALVQEDMGRILDSVQLAIRQSGEGASSRGLRRRNAAVAAGCRRERELLARDPDAVIAKLRRVQSRFWVPNLGRARPSAFLLGWRIMERAFKATRHFAVGRHFPFLFHSQFQIVAEDAVPRVMAEIATSAEPWYWHVHLMDIHDCQNVRRVKNIVNQMRYLPRMIGAMLRGVRLRHKFNYLLAVMHVDDMIGHLVRRLDELGKLDDTVILVTADHALAYGSSPRKWLPIERRIHAEDIEIPLIVAGGGIEPDPTGLANSMDIPATLLACLGLPGHESFRGRSVQLPGREAVVTEMAGKGNADLARKTLFFTVTTARHRLGLELRGSELVARELYDRVADPGELRNLVAENDSAETIEELTGHLWAEREQLLAWRGVVRHPDAPALRVEAR